MAETDTRPRKKNLKSVNLRTNNVQDIQKYLHNNEALNAAFENAPIGMALSDLQGYFLRVNKSLSQMLGYSKKELTSMNFKELSLPDELEANLKLRGEAVEGKRDGYQLEKRYIHKDGHIIWGLLSATIIRNKKNVSLYFIGQLQDITEQKKAKEHSNTLNEINAVINSTLDINKVMTDVLRTSALAIGADTGALLKRKNDEWEVSHEYGFPTNITGMKIKDYQFLSAGVSLKNRKPVLVNDICKSKIVNQDMAKKFGNQSILTAGLVVEKEIEGAIAFCHPNKNAFNDSHVNFVEKLAASLSLALKNADLYSAEQEANKLGNALNDINASINSTLNHNEIMEKVVFEAAKAIGCDASAIIDYKNNQWQINQSFGLPVKKSLLISGKDIACSMKAITENRIMVDNRTGTHDGHACCLMMEKYDTRSKLSAPLCIKGKALGVIDFYYLKKPVSFTQPQIDFAKKIASSVSLAIDNASLYEAERQIANTLQEAILNVPEKIEGVEYGYFYKSASDSAKVGGDFYDIFEIDEKRIGILVGDVSGKGVKAATLTSTVRNSIRALSFHRFDISHIVAMANDVVLKENRQSDFVTLFFGIINKKTGALSYCSCGHPPSLIKQKSKVQLLKTSSPALGLAKKAEFIEESAKLEKTDILLLYTDGITESRCLSKEGKTRGFFGEERLIKSVSGQKNPKTKDLPKHIFKTVLDCAGCKLSDDVVVFSLSLK